MPCSGRLCAEAAQPAAGGHTHEPGLPGAFASPAGRSAGACPRAGLLEPARRCSLCTDSCVGWASYAHIIAAVALALSWLHLQCASLLNSTLLLEVPAHSWAVRARHGRPARQAGPEACWRASREGGVAAARAGHLPGCRPPAGGLRGRPGAACGASQAPCGAAGHASQQGTARTAWQLRSVLPRRSSAAEYQSRGRRSRLLPLQSSMHLPSSGPAAALRPPAHRCRGQRACPTAPCRRRRRRPAAIPAQQLPNGRGSTGGHAADAAADGGHGANGHRAPARPQVPSAALLVDEPAHPAGCPAQPAAGRRPLPAAVGSRPAAGA